MHNEYPLVTELKELYRRLTNLETITFRGNPAGFEEGSKHLRDEIAAKERECRDAGVNPLHFL